jgi:hypothetical protein
MNIADVSSESPYAMVPAGEGPVSSVTLKWRGCRFCYQGREREVVGEAELGGGVDHLRDPVPGDHPGQVVPGRGLGHGRPLDWDSRAMTGRIPPL